MISLKKFLPVVLFFIAALSFNLTAQPKGKVDPRNMPYQKVGGPLPQLSVETPDYQTITNRDIKSKNHLFLIIFNPKCGTCQQMAELFAGNAGLFKNSTVIFMTKAESQSGVKDFENKTGLAGHPEFIVGTDKTYAIDKLANYGLLPLINVYDANHNLVKTFNGKTSLDALKKYLP